MYILKRYSHMVSFLTLALCSFLCCCTLCMLYSIYCIQKHISDSRGTDYYENISSLKNIHGNCGLMMNLCIAWNQYVLICTCTKSATLECCYICLLSTFIAWYCHPRHKFNWTKKHGVTVISRLLYEIKGKFRTSNILL